MYDEKVFNSFHITQGNALNLYLKSNVLPCQNKVLITLVLNLHLMISKVVFLIKLKIAKVSCLTLNWC